MPVRNPLLLTAALLLLMLAPALAQNNSADQSDSNQSWNSSTSLQDQTGAANPTQVKRAHEESDGKTVDTQTLETQGINGGTQVYGQTETETVRVNATTTRTTTRHFVTNTDGEKVLNSITVEEKRESPDGGESVERTSSTPDANGALQVIRREMQESSQTAADTRTTNTTVLLPGADGALAPSTRTHEVEKQVQPGVTEYNKSVSLRDGNGNWQLNEERQGTIEKSGDTQIRQESVSRLNADGRMALAERTVTRETNTEGEQRKESQKFSTSMNGTTVYPDGKMHLDRQVTTTTHTGAGGEQVTQEEVSQRSPAAPDEGLRPSQHVIDITRTDLQGVKQQTESIETANPNGSMGVVWVDTSKTAGSGPIVVDTSKAPSESQPQKGAKQAPNQPPH